MNVVQKQKNSPLRAVAAGGVTIGVSNIQQAAQFHGRNCSSEEAGIAAERIDINEIKIIPFQVTLRQDSRRVRMRHRPSPPVAGNPRKIPQNYAIDTVIRVVCEHEIGLRLRQVPQRPNPAPAHRVENPEAALGSLAQGRREHAEVAAGGALVAEEGVADVELQAALGLELGFADIDGFEVRA